MCWLTPKLGWGRSLNVSTLRLGLNSQSLMSSVAEDMVEEELDASLATAVADLVSFFAMSVAESAAASCRALSWASFVAAGSGLDSRPVANDLLCGKTELERGRDWRRGLNRAVEGWGRGARQPWGLVSLMTSVAFASQGVTATYPQPQRDAAPKHCDDSRAGHFWSFWLRWK